MKKTITIIIVGMIVLLLGAVIVSTYPDWQSGVWYDIGDKVTYDGTDYECIQAHTSQTGWEPPNVPALWEEILEEPPEGSWAPGVWYDIGEIVSYNGTNYSVRQAHTSQTGWEPPNVPALFLIYEGNSQVGYMGVEYDSPAEEYLEMNQSELIEIMNFQYLKAEETNDGIRYVWNHYKPQMRNNTNIQWIQKPIRETIPYETISLCFDEHTGQECFDTLVTGENNLTINNQSYTPVIEKAEGRAFSEVQSALELKNKLQEQVNDFLNYGEPGEIEI